MAVAMPKRRRIRQAWANAGEVDVNNLDGLYARLMHLDGMTNAVSRRRAGDEPVVAM